MPLFGRFSNTVCTFIRCSRVASGPRAAREAFVRVQWRVFSLIITCFHYSSFWWWWRWSPHCQCIYEKLLHHFSITTFLSFPILVLELLCVCFWPQFLIVFFTQLSVLLWSFFRFLGWKIGSTFVISPRCHIGKKSLEAICQSHHKESNKTLSITL